MRKSNICTSCGATGTQIENGLCEWCAAGGWIPDGSNNLITPKRPEGYKTISWQMQNL